MGSDETNQNMEDSDDEEDQAAYQRDFYDKELNLPSRTALYNGKIKMEFQACISLFDTAREKQYEVGRNYKFQELELGECNINSKATNTLGVKEGDVVYFDIVINSLMQFIVQKYNTYA